MAESSLLHTFRNERKESCSLNMNVNVQMKQKILNFILTGTARMNLAFDFVKDETKLNVTYCRCCIQHLKQPERCKPKEWQHMTENIYHLTHMINTFSEDNDDDWINIKAFMQVKNEKTTADCQYFTMTSQAGKTIPGYDKSLLCLKRIRPKVYRFTFVLTTKVKYVDYMDKFEGEAEFL